MKRILILLMIISNMAFAEYSSTSKDIQENSLTIYNGGFGLVREIRDSSNISNSEKIINYLDVAQKIEPDSIIVNGVNILSLNYEYDLVSMNKLLEKYIGEDVIYTKNKSKINCTLLSVKGGIVLKDKKSGEIYLGVGVDKIILPKMIEGLRLKPALIWDIEEGTSSNELEVSYLTKGIKWEANYVINLENKRLNLIGWVNINNNSGKDYKNTKLKLIAGDVNRANNNEGLFLMKRSMLASNSPKDNFKEKSFFDYHMYTLNRNLNVKNNQSKQIKFISGNNIKYKKYYSYSNTNKETKVIVSFENSKNNGLGIAFPKGKIKIYKKDLEDNSSEFVGEDRINHTPKDENIKVVAGKVFDVKVEYKEINYKKISKRIYEKTIKYTIKNHKNEKIKINIEHSLYGDWEMLNSNTKYVKDSIKKIIFPIDINRDSTYVLKFTYRVKR
ncbi:DUF4139 domain-containing protein [Haliovirga abyssi]|uniref:DUF4139 domain-containing protein n=1 Tax=Haliovirga abyssi TaxID=2996794 RepID=A0AAU9DR01_9FUSO|nr:DUF4139 domain-containing protein [Haliovirga abyssi]BDU50953.1 DUF4139 domain-containing protein [Haliovirga abyssi]